MAASERSSTISLPATVVADANVILSALIGGRARLVIASARGPRCVAADAVAGKIAEHVPRLSAKKLKLTAKGTFTPTGKTPITATRVFVLKR